MWMPWNPRRLADPNRSLGWLTESTIIPKIAREIGGVSSNTLVGLKAALYEKEEEVRMRQSVAVGPHATNKEKGTTGKLKRKLTQAQRVVLAKNRGVEARDHRDAEEIRAEEEKAKNALAIKAALYDKMMKGEVTDELENFLVDFQRKAAGDGPIHPRDESAEDRRGKKRKAALDAQSYLADRGLVKKPPTGKFKKTKPKARESDEDEPHGNTNAFFFDYGTSVVKPQKKQQKPKWMQMQIEDEQISESESESSEEEDEEDENLAQESDKHLFSFFGLSQQLSKPEGFDLQGSLFDPLSDAHERMRAKEEAEARGKMEATKTDWEMDSLPMSFGKSGGGGGGSSVAMSARSLVSGDMRREDERRRWESDARQEDLEDIQRRHKRELVKAIYSQTLSSRDRVKLLREERRKAAEERAQLLKDRRRGASSSSAAPPRME